MGTAGNAITQSASLVLQLGGEKHAKSAPEEWALNPKMLKTYIEREPDVLKAEDVANAHMQRRAARLRHAKMRRL